MNRLAFNRAYLVGAMDRVADGGVGWRDYIKRELEYLKIVFLDPCRKPIKLGVEDMESRKARREAKTRGDYDLVTKDMNIIRYVDLRMVSISDFLIVNIDLDVHACGTYNEITLATEQDKPIIVHIEQGKEHTPDWLLAMVPHQTIFSTWAELISYLRHIAHDEFIDDLNRWCFFDFTGEHV